MPGKATLDALSDSLMDADIDDKATASYVRRTLCAHHIISAAPLRPVHDLLPPLSSSNTLDLQLYAIIAVLLKEFVQTWYSKITPDYHFVDEIVQIIAHCTRALEQRSRVINIDALVFDEIPHLIRAHISGESGLVSRTLLIVFYILDLIPAADLISFQDLTPVQISQIFQS